MTIDMREYFNKSEVLTVDEIYTNIEECVKEQDELKASYLLGVCHSFIKKQDEYIIELSRLLNESVEEINRLQGLLHDK